MLEINKSDLVAKFKAEAEDLVRRANAAGVIITVDTQPLKPLAMRNYRLVVDARESR
jgi:predicted peroxiredoxin